MASRWPCVRHRATVERPGLGRGRRGLEAGSWITGWQTQRPGLTSPRPRTRWCRRASAARAWRPAVGAVARGGNVTAVSSTRARLHRAGLLHKDGAGDFRQRQSQWCPPCRKWRSFGKTEGRGCCAKDGHGGNRAGLLRSRPSAYASQPHRMVNNDRLARLNGLRLCHRAGRARLDIGAGARK